ncbi:hypothetical protein CWI39_0861p0010 [Hamiltosporidium magnivora]|uniref:Uncharacterized protein n=1 Tax=Hamiltosporidium magnivora TaxID=148818 RepID=A0A4Q9L8K3_9MICR|nr:hypothetical protein CWI39_0861p0010 [Hamiltosporidium magnivora]
MIEKFDKDFKRVSKTEKFKKSRSECNAPKFPSFGNKENICGFSISKHKNELMNLEEVFNTFHQNDLNKIINNYEVIERIIGFFLDRAKFPSVICNMNFLTNIGFRFKVKHPIKDIYKLTNLISKELKEEMKKSNLKFILFKIINQKDYKVTY